MLVADDLPELCADLVTALAGLDVDDFAHLWSLWLHGGETGGDSVTESTDALVATLKGNRGVLHNIRKAARNFGGPSERQGLRKP